MKIILHNTARIINFTEIHGENWAAFPLYFQHIVFTKFTINLQEAIYLQMSNNVQQFYHSFDKVTLQKIKKKNYLIDFFAEDFK